MALGSSSSRAVELVFRGDNRSAVKALKGIEEQSSKTTRTMKTGADEQTVALNRVKDSSERLRGAMVGLAGFVGIGGVAFGIKDLVQGGMALQSSQAQLQAALNATGQAAGGTQGRLQSFAESLSTRGGFATVQNLSTLTAYVRETHNASQAQNMLALATNIARGRNMDLSSSQTIVARAYTGSVGRLQQLLGPMVAQREAAVGLSTAHAQLVAQLQAQASTMGKVGAIWLHQQEINDHITAQQAALATLTDKHATAVQVLAAAQQEFAGSTATYANTTQGKISNLKNTFQNLVDNLGKALLPTVNAVVGAFAKLAEFLAQNKGLVAATIGPVLALAGAWGAMKVLQTIRNMARDLMVALRLTGAAGMAGGEEAAAGAAVAETGWKAFMTSTVVGLVLVGLVELVEHWKQVKQVAVVVWKAIEVAAAATWHWIEGAAGTVWHALSWPFQQAGSIASGVFHAIEGAVTGAWHFIEHVASAIFNAITWPFRKAFDFIKGGWDDVKGVFSTIGNFVGGLFSEGGVVHAVHRAAGGPIYRAVGGPSGTDTVPAWLTPGEGVLSTQAMAGIGGAPGLNALNSGQAPGLGGRVTITPSPVTMRLDNRVLAQSVIRYVLNQAARGTSNAVGGSLVLGAPGLPVAGAARVG